MLTVSRAVQVSLRGEYDLANATELSQLLQRAEYAQQVTLDCRALEYLDSASMTVIFRMQQTVERAGGTVVIIGMRPNIRKIFRITRLEALFTFED